MFVLLARDPFAPLLVELWAEMRKIARRERDDKVAEARQCANAMREWHRRRK